MAMRSTDVGLYMLSYISLAEVDLFLYHGKVTNRPLRGAMELPPVWKPLNIGPKYRIYFKARRREIMRHIKLFMFPLHSQKTP